MLGFKVFKERNWTWGLVIWLKEISGRMELWKLLGNGKKDNGELRERLIVERMLEFLVVGIKVGYVFKVV